MDAYNHIKQAIILGKYKPGMRLTELSLAEELKLSRTPVREAIKQLTSEGLIIPLSRGISVRDFNEKDLRQIYNLRALLESYAAMEAAFHRTEENLLKMEDSNDTYEKAVKQYHESNEASVRNIVQANSVFHEAILEASKNEHLRFHLSKVVVVPLVFRSFNYYDENQLLRSLDAHKTILEAIKNQEPERAKIALHEHILQGRDHVLKHLEKLKDE